MIATIEIVGLLAGALTTASLVPQVYKIWKTKSAENISLTMFLLFFIGVLLWFTYGIVTHSIAMIVANSITAVLAIVIIYFKLKYK